MIIHKKIIFVVILGIMCLGVLFASARIENLKKNPQRFDGREVTIRALVDRTIHIPLTKYSVYVVEDNGYRLPLFSRDEYTTGETIRCKVKVIAFTDSYSNEEKRRTSVDRLAGDFARILSISESKAEAIGSSVIKIVSAITGSIEGTYLLIGISDNRS